ncbi:hypothetical protein GGI12_006211, partial [Dipsacomyces acuminosporus]
MDCKAQLNLCISTGYTSDLHCNNLIRGTYISPSFCADLNALNVNKCNVIYENCVGMRHCEIQSGSEGPHMTTCHYES